MILLGIALVFTFNALVAIMQFIADEDTLGAGILDNGKLARASRNRLGILSGVFIIVFMVIFPLMATYGITHGRRKSVKFWYQCTATASFLPVTYKFALQHYR